MGNPSENDKAARYISQLDEARCAGRWREYAEFCRKIEKHAPHRRCLTLTARSEAQIAAHSTQRPSTSVSTPAPDLSKIIPTLLTAIEEENDYVQDAFQATVCLGWLHYVLEEPGLSVARLPKDFAAVATKISNAGPLSGWTRVCIIKGAFLKGSSHDKTGSVEDAVQTYNSVIPWLSALSIDTESSLFKSWTERLLVRLCQLADQSDSNSGYLDPEDSLHAYRFWAKYWESTGKSSGTESMAQPRRSAWKAYYDTLSEILRHDLDYRPETIPDSAVGKAHLEGSNHFRLQQRAELKKVEAIYESLLLKETHFPKAINNNNEIEAWTDSVMANWRFLCGPTWSDSDLGEGGKEAVGRGVLDVLYRAATKTFHSTQVLRHLFTVHASLAEFDLAFKAYESYVDIVTRGKDRAEKSGEQDVGIDDDSTVLRTSAEAIRLLCRFGSRTEAEKATRISSQIEKWLEQAYNIRSSTSESGSVDSIEGSATLKSLAIAYCAMGVAQAHWARLTYEAGARTAMQTKAIQYLRKSLEPKLNDSNNLDALYALGLVLAEMRDIAAAIKVVKRALSPATANRSSISADGVLSNGLSTEFGRERKLVKLWHLLALLLTARSEFSAAEKACEAAFQQFGDPTILFGEEDADAGYRSDHLNEAKGIRKKPQGLVDKMESFEKGGILQIKMTQLALVEIVDGCGAAVDGCDELLALYARLFGDVAEPQTNLQPVVMAPPPKSAVGTIRGSIFRSRGSIKSAHPDKSARTSSIVSSQPSTVAAQGGAAPAIQVTDETGDDLPKNSHNHHIFHHKHDEEKASVTRTPSKLQKRSANSLRRKSELDGGQVPNVPDIPDSVSSTPARNSTIRTKSPRRPSISSSTRKSVESHDRPLRSVAHNMSHTTEPPPGGHSKQPPKQDTRLPAPFPDADYVPPDPRFSKLQTRRHQVSLLANIWIFISGLYTRAKMFEDAKGAVGEALKLAETFEGEVAQETSSSKAFAQRGWGGGKSIEELWADAFSARGELAVSQDQKHIARTDFERALLHFPDHPESTVGLSNILLDIYCKNISLEPVEGNNGISHVSATPGPTTSSPSVEIKPHHLASHTPSAENQVSPPELNRLAARDRAFGLLSTLTKLGTGWDYSEAWYTLARAYEESGQVEKTKEVLWWCIELEDTHPVRPWRALGSSVL